MRVVPSAIEQSRLEVDACTARALSGAGAAWSLAEPHLAPGGRLIYFAGRSWSGQGIDRGQGTRTSSTSGVLEEICAPGRFPWQGPLVIMRRASDHSAP